MFQSIRSVLTASLGGFQFGYNTAIISGAILFLRKEFSLSSTLEGLVVSMILIGALLGASIAGMCADTWGRRKTLGLTAILFLVGALWSAYAPSISALLLGRSIQGIALGTVSLAAPLYLAEIAPAEKRGRYVSANQLAITIGILASYICNYAWASSQNWRSMLGFAAFPALLQLLGLFFISESPSWEKKKNTSWKLLLTPRFRRPLFIGVFLSIFQQITGINAVIYFAPSIFQDAGFSSASGAILATVGIGIINVIATTFSLWLLDRVGRRPLLLWGLGGMVASLLILSSAFFIQSEVIDTIAIASLTAYVASFALGMGPVPWLIISEIYPLEIRGRAMSLATLANWFSNFLIAFTFLDLAATLTSGGVFLLFAATGAAAILFTWKFIPETKGLALEEIAKKISSR
jgi:SP family galactose:H+ symporter-like MFS transporter